MFIFIKLGTIKECFFSSCTAKLKFLSSNFINKVILISIQTFTIKLVLITNVIPINSESIPPTSFTS